MKQFVLLASLLVSATAFANDVDPFNFEKEHFSGSMSRTEAIANSNAPAGVGIDIDNDGRVVTGASTKTRAEVAAETREAARLGLIGFGRERGYVSGSPAEEQQIRVAGERAINHSATTE